MTYVTIEAEIANGRLVLGADAQLPERGRALVTVMPELPRSPDWKMVESVLGILRRPGLDSGAWQREIRSEWDRG
jgi:hypothetical protein